MISFLLLGLLFPQDAKPNFARSSFETQTPDQLVSLVDLSGDQSLELLIYTGFGVEVRGFGPSGELDSTPLASYLWDSESVAWTLADLEGDGVQELVTFEGAERCIVHRYEAGKGFIQSTILKHGADVPRGVFRMDFLRDVDGDGLQDLVLPQLGSFAIFLQAEDHSFGDPLLVQYETRVNLSVGSPKELDSGFGQNISIPWFELRDVDGDGIQDLVSKADTKIHFHLGSPKISSAPSWTLDLGALEAELPADEGIDFDNLLGQATRGVSWKLADLDGQVPNELILRVGSKFRIYSAGSRSGPLGNPSQVLKSSGNVLFFILRDVLGDSKPELQIMRGEKIGIGQAIRWLVIPGSIDFDVFTYENKAGSFSRRPTRRNKLTLDIPRILAFAERMQKFSEKSVKNSLIPTQRIALGADGRSDDVLDLNANELQIFLNSVEPEDEPEPGRKPGTDGAIDGFMENHVDPLGDGGSKTFDLGEVEEWVTFASAELRASVQGKQPSQRFSLPPGLSQVRIRILDINHNGKLDFIVLGHPLAEQEEPEPAATWALHFFIH